MALADRLKEDPRLPTGIPCSVGVVLEQLGNSAEGKALRKMMYELHWSGTKIFQALLAEGIVVGQQQINRHRSEGCGCWR